MKLLLWCFGIFLLIGFAAAFPQWPFRTSEANRAIAEKEYPSNSFHDICNRYMCKAFGDEFPKMRDDIARRKNNGEGFWKRHWNAWTNWGNWWYDPNNDYNEEHYRR